MKVQTRIAAMGVSGALLVGALMAPSLAYGATTDPAPSPSHGQQHKLTAGGKNYDVYVMNDVDLTQPVQIAQSDGSLKEVKASAVDGASQSASGNASTGFTADVVTPLSTSWTSWIAPGSNQWYTSVNGYALAGSNASFQAGYSIRIDSNSIGGACFQIKGFKQYTNPSGGKYYDEYWKNIGCAPGGGSVGGNVIWGSVLAYKQIKMKAETPPVGSAGLFN
jgi:hypothetical protein